MSTKLEVSCSKCIKRALVGPSNASQFREGLIIIQEVLVRCHMATCTHVNYDCGSRAILDEGYAIRFDESD